MHVYTVVSQQSLRHAGPGAQAAESDGYDGLMTMENAHDPFMPLAVAAGPYRAHHPHDRDCHCLSAQPDGGGEYGLGLA